MIAKITIAALVLVLCLVAPVRAQFPAGLLDDIKRVKTVPGVPFTRGHMPEVWVDPATTGTATGGSAVNACTAVTSYNGQWCSSDGTQSACCAVKYKVERCQSQVSAPVLLNNKHYLCCITLFRQKDNSPAMWCAGPSAPAYYSLPSSALVEVYPICVNYFKSVDKNRSGVGSMACAVTLPEVPSGFVAPRGYNSKKPLVYNKGGDFPFPCQSDWFRRQVQVDTIKDNKLYITSKCD